jgi:hypothetical protein
VPTFPISGFDISNFSPSPARAAESFVTDPAYIRYAAARRSGSESRFQLIDDTDLAGTIGLILAADRLSKS